MKYVCLFGLLLSTGLANAQSGTEVLKNNSDNNTLLWEITGNGLNAPGYLFGTFHLLCKHDINFSSSLIQAVTNSKEIYLELDMDDPATLLGGLMLMNMKEGKKLKDLYTEDEYKRVSEFFKDSLKTPISVFQRMKPEFLLAMLYPKLMPCKSIGSVEDAVMQLAKKQNKEIKGLETMAFQASLFDSIPYEKQAKELLHMIDSLETYKLNFDQLMNAYKKQQLHEMERLLNDPESGIAENRDDLLDKRNKNWVKQLKEIMPETPVFVAVGAGHLVGTNGLIALLRLEGYTLRGLENK